MFYSVHHTQCHPSPFVAFWTSNSDACKHLRTLAGVCTEMANYPLGLSVPWVLGWLRRHHHPSPPSSSSPVAAAATTTAQFPDAVVDDIASVDAKSIPA